VRVNLRVLCDASRRLYSYLNDEFYSRYVTAKSTTSNFADEWTKFMFTNLRRGGPRIRISARRPTILTELSCATKTINIVLTTFIECVFSLFPYFI
jgi:hypothetical protein